MRNTESVFGYLRQGQGGGRVLIGLIRVIELELRLAAWLTPVLCRQKFGAKQTRLAWDCMFTTSM